MTPINLETALNLPLLEPAPYHAGTKLEPNNCFDGHLQRASSTQSTDKNSSPPANETTGRTSNSSRSNSSEAEQSNVDNRPAAEGRKDDVEASVGNDAAADDHVASDDAPIESGAIENEC